MWFPCVKVREEHGTVSLWIGRQVKIFVKQPCSDNVTCMSMCVSSELRGDAGCCGGGRRGCSVAVCAARVPGACAAQASCWETLLLLPQSQRDQRVSFVLQGTAVKCICLNHFWKRYVPRIRNAVHVGGSARRVMQCSFGFSWGR